jgi:putative membrane protein
MTLERFFPAEARERVARAVGEAESRSLGQIVPVVVERSGDYDEVPWIGGVLLAAVATAAIELLRLDVALWELPVLQLAAGILGALLSRLDPVERLLAGKRDLDETTRDRALRAFLENGLDRTAQGTGVLVFASLFEHRAHVVGDHGIHEKMGDQGWREGVEALVAGIRRGDPAAGFCDAIGMVGAKLAEHFPRPAGGAAPNELPDELRGSRT